MGLRDKVLGGIAALAVMLGAYTAHAGSIRFFGTGTNDVDRIKIRIDAPEVPADVGADNFTIEFWMKGTRANNTTTFTITCGNGSYQWINGRIIFDRDRFGQDRAFGISVGGNGRLAFGANVLNDTETICGTTDVLDDAWHHVAVTRNRVSGEMKLFVDGTQEAVGNGPVGDMSYPNNATPMNSCGGPCVNDPFIVLGAEKHDATPDSPSFNGFMDELRISGQIQYPGNFARPTQPFIGNELGTVALYHLDETGTTDNVSDVKGASPGVRRPTGTPPNDRPQWSADTPFTQAGNGQLQFSQQQYFVAEGDGTLAAAVTRTGGSNGTASVVCTTVNVTAQAPDDFTAVSPTLNWAAGDSTEKLCNVPIIADATAEGAETFQVTLSQPSNATIGNPDTAIVTISENSTAGTMRFQQQGFVVDEGVGTFNVTVTRANGSVGAVSVTVSTQDGSAIAGSDYTTSTTVLNWADGETAAKTAAITVNNDSTEEGSETFTVSLSNVTGGASIGAPSSATVTINANDSPSGGGGGGGGGGSIDWLFLLGGLLGVAGLGRAASNRRQRQHELKQLDVAGNAA